MSRRARPLDAVTPNRYIVDHMRKRKEDMTDEERQAASERMARARAARSYKSGVEKVEGGSSAVSAETAAPVTSPGAATNTEPEPPPLLDKEALGRLAHQLVGNPAVATAFKDAAEACAKEWANTDLLDSGKREQLYHDMQALKRLSAQLNKLSQAGKIASLQRSKLVA